MDIQILLLIVVGLLVTASGAGVYYFKFKKLNPQLEKSHKDLLEKPSQEGQQLSASESVEVEKVEVQKATRDLRSALEGTRNNFFGRLKSSISSSSKLTDEDMESLEEVLYTSDLGPATVQRLVEAVSSRLDSQSLGNLETIRLAIKDEMTGIFADLNQKGVLLNDIDTYFKEVTKDQQGPRVMMVVGVNGVGKTTTIGKLANRSAYAGLKTMVVAGDTFRAAAEDQLKVWADRANVEVFSPEGVKDPSAVIFDGIKSGASKGLEMIIVDTAGRLHTQDNLMEELKKMRRVMDKVLPGAPHEILLVLDSNSGQNALVQAKTFHQALEIDGVVLTKLDGSAKGGVAVGIACELGLPIKLIGVGEGIEDLRPFNSEEFVESIL